MILTTFKTRFKVTIFFLAMINIQFLQQGISLITCAIIMAQRKSSVTELEPAESITFLSEHPVDVEH